MRKIYDRIDENSVVGKLMSKNHLQCAELQSLEQQLMHARLQVDALKSREYELMTEKEQQLLELADSEQEIILLRVQFSMILFPCASYDYCWCAICRQSYKMWLILSIGVVADLWITLKTCAESY